jgi:hypothetical protein
MDKKSLRESKNDELIEDLLKDPNYKINKDGTVYTRITLNGQGISSKWRQVGYKKEDGYVRFRYKGEFLFVQRVIYRAFNGPLDSKKTINHIDLNRSNNHPSNLEQVTQGNNNKKKRKKYKKEGIMLNRDKLIKMAVEKIKTSKHKVDWDKMFDTWSSKTKELANQLVKLGPPPTPGSDKDFNKWKKEYDVINLNIKSLEEDALKFTEKYKD